MWGEPTYAVPGQKISNYELLTQPMFDYGHILFAFTLLFFFFEWASHQIGKRYVKSYTTEFTEAQRIDWGIRAVAIIHAFATYPNLYNYIYADKSFQENIYEGNTSVQYFFMFSVSYFIWDVIVTLYHRLELVWLVHAIFAGGSFYFSAHPFAHYYGTFFHACFELSTPFIHLRELLTMCKNTDSWYYGASEKAFAIIFSICRVFMGVYHSYYFHRDMYTLLWTGTAHNTLCVFFYLLSNTIVIGLQLYWFTLIVRAVIFPSPPPAKKQD